MALHSAEYARLGASVVAIVAQPSEKVKRYVEDTGLPFDILVDERRETIKAYGVWHRVGIDAWNIARPALFLIDIGGVVRYVFVADWQTEFPEHGEIVRELEKLGQVSR
jgi:peroxiredoxin